MKKLSLFFAFCALVGTTFAQVADGTYAQNFSLYEIDKTTGQLITSTPITLYQYTDAGKAVIMDVSATWCAPCWSYHNSGALESVYAQYGPEGTDELQVLFIEGSNGNYASLSGTGPDANGSATQGNWLSGVEYPVIPLRMDANASSYNSFHSNYGIAYFPTVYLICPNRTIYEVGQKTAPVLYSSIGTTCPQFDNTLMNNGLLLSVSGIEGNYFCSATLTPTVQLQNVGELDLTSAEFTIECNGQTSTYTWTGNLTRYNTATVTLPQVSIPGGGNYTYTVTLTNVNNVPDADPVQNVYTKSFTVQAEGTATPVNETFSSALPNGWTMENGLLGFYNLNGSHGYAVYFDCYDLSSGVTENLYIPMSNLTGMNTPALKFDVAYKRYSTSTNDRLKVQYSTNCGTNWTTAYNKAGAELSPTSGVSTSQYIPSGDSDWRTETVDLSACASSTDAIIRFNFTSNYGNVMWIDNVRIVEATGVENHDGAVSVYPNPATNVLNISASESVESAVIYNVAGQVVMTENGHVNSINISNLASGSYIVRIQTVDGNITNQRFIKE